MRILAFNYEYPPLGGGGGVVFKNLYDELSRRHQVAIVTTLYQGLPRFESRNGQEIYRVPVFHRTDLRTATMPSMMTYPLTSWRCGRRLLASRRFDLINSHFVVPTAPSAQLLASQFKTRHVLSLYGGDLYDPSKKLSPHRLALLPSVIRSLLNRADRVIAGSSDTAGNARQIYGIERPIDVIPLAIVPFEIPQGSRRSFGIGEEQFVMATVGRLIARKGLEDLLRVVRELDDPRDLLLVIGSGPAKGSLQNLALELGIEKKVRFTGWVSDEEKWGLLSVSDLYASTSLHEGFGLVFLEAMHCGLPVVCYDRGGQTDFLENGRTGALVPLGKSDAFVQAMRRFKSEGELARSCAAFNLELVKNFYIDRYAEQHEMLFDEVIRERRRTE